MVVSHYRNGAAGLVLLPPFPDQPTKVSEVVKMSNLASTKFLQTVIYGVSLSLVIWQVALIDDISPQLFDILKLYMQIM